MSFCPIQKLVSFSSKPDEVYTYPIGYTPESYQENRKVLMDKMFFTKKVKSFEIKYLVMLKKRQGLGYISCKHN